jgi:hypothetical protein
MSEEYHDFLLEGTLRVSDKNSFFGNNNIEKR